MSVGDKSDNFVRDGARFLGVTPEQFYDFLELFLEVSRKDIESMRQAIAVVDRIGVASAAHSIKGAAISLGLTSIVELAVIAEDFSKTGEFADVGTTLEAIVAECDVLKGFLHVKSDDASETGERVALTLVLIDQNGEI